MPSVDASTSLGLGNVSNEIGMGVRIDMSLGVRMDMRRVQNIATWLGAQYIDPRTCSREMVTHWQAPPLKALLPMLCLPWPTGVVFDIELKFIYLWWIRVMMSCRTKLCIVSTRMVKVKRRGSRHRWEV
jgi:hypothetical protein